MWDYVKFTFRTTNVRIGGARHTPADPLDVPHHMRALCDWIKGAAGGLHRVSQMAW